MTTDAREKFFEMLQVVAENRYFKDVYAVEFFLSVFEMHRENAEGVITAENMTTAEKEMVRSHLPDFLHNTGICFRGIFSDTPRELLSGMVVFRLEVLPVLLPCISRYKSWYAQLLSFMVRKESAILRNLGRGRKFSSERLPIRNPSHALHKHPWWQGDFKFTQVIESNYELAD